MDFQNYFFCSYLLSRKEERNELFEMNTLPEVDHLVHRIHHSSVCRLVWVFICALDEID